MVLSLFEPNLAKRAANGDIAGLIRPALQTRSARSYRCEALGVARA